MPQQRSWRSPINVTILQVCFKAACSPVCTHCEPDTHQTTPSFIPLTRGNTSTYQVPDLWFPWEKSINNTMLEPPRRPWNRCNILTPCTGNLDLVSKLSQITYLSSPRWTLRCVPNHSAPCLGGSNWFSVLSLVYHLPWSTISIRSHRTSLNNNPTKRQYFQVWWEVYVISVTYLKMNTSNLCFNTILQHYIGMFPYCLTDIEHLQRL